MKDIVLKISTIGIALAFLFVLYDFGYNRGMLDQLDKELAYTKELHYCPGPIRERHPDTVDL